MKRSRRAAIAGAFGVIGLVGVLHAPFARGILARAGGCPVGRASAADVDTARRDALASVRGNAATRAPVRPALAFVLEKTTPEMARTWASSHGVTCVDKREGLLLACNDATDGTARELMLAFRPSDRVLVNLTAVSFQLSPADAAARMSRTVSRLTGELGAPRSDGEVTETNFARGGYATAVSVFAFQDYVAEVSATSIDGRGVTLREHYVVTE